MALTAKTLASIVGEFTKALDVGEASYPLAYSANNAFANGTGANQANVAFSDERTLAASGSEELDFAGGLSDAFGNTVTMTKIKALLIRADPANTNDVLVGGASSNALDSLFGDATDVVAVKPGGTFMLVAPNADGYAVVAGTGDLLQVENSAGGTGVTYTVVAIGVA